MRRQRITVWHLATVSVFAISCFCLLLLLWTTSGGPTPLAPRSYRVHVLLPQAKGLGPHSDVRVAGVTVGHVISVNAAHPVNLDRADVLIDLERPFVPLRADARAMLRGKSILGEAYVALSLGSRAAPSVRDGGTLPARNALDAVSPDQIFDTYDPATRRALREWQQTEGPVVAARGHDLNVAIGSLRPWMVDADGLLSLVQGQGRAVRGLLADGGAIANGLADRADALQELARSGDRAFNATGRQGAALAAAFRELPGFEREATRTVRAMTSFAESSTGDVHALRAELGSLSPALEQLSVDAPALHRIVGATPALERASRRGLPALAQVLGSAPPLLERLDPFLRSLNPALRAVAGGRSELTGVLANLSAATQTATATPLGRDPLHYLRAMIVLAPSALAPLSKRPGSNRANAYPDPSIASTLLGGMPSAATSHCSNPTPYITPDPSPNLSDDQRHQVFEFAFLGDPSSVPAPPCRATVGTVP
jgi:phospholipid/cholesterol/gamma-HCH transport system substrate-binding protein